MRRSSRNGISEAEIAQVNFLLNEVSTDEIRRMMITKETGILSPKAEEKYDRIISVACRAFDVSSSLISC